MHLLVIHTDNTVYGHNLPEAIVAWSQTISPNAARLVKELSSLQGETKIEVLFRMYRRLPRVHGVAIRSCKSMVTKDATSVRYYVSTAKYREPAKPGSPPILEYGESDYYAISDQSEEPFLEHLRTTYELEFRTLWKEGVDCKVIRDESGKDILTSLLPEKQNPTRKRVGEIQHSQEVLSP